MTTSHFLALVGEVMCGIAAYHLAEHVLAQLRNRRNRKSGDH